MISQSTIISVFIAEIKKIFTIEGRTSRKQYLLCSFTNWNIQFLEFVIAFITTFIIAYNAYMNTGRAPDFSFPFIHYPINANLLLALYCIYKANSFVFSFTQNVRRLHDLGHSGWFMLWFLIPLINFLVIFYVFFAHGEEGNNKYGEQPVDQKLTMLDKNWLWISLIILVLILVFYIVSKLNAL